MQFTPSASLLAECMCIKYNLYIIYASFFTHKCTCRDSKRKFRKFQILQIIEFVKSIKRDHCNKIKLKIKNERDWLKKKKEFSLFIYFWPIRTQSQLWTQWNKTQLQLTDSEHCNYNSISSSIQNRNEIPSNMTFL